MTGFWKTDHFVTFDIIDNSVYLRHSKWYYWINSCLNPSKITLPSKYRKYFGSMYLLKLRKHKHGNYIYFMRDNMVCFQNPVTNNGNNCALIRTMEVHARAFSHVAAWRCYLWALQGCTWLHFLFEVCSSIVFSSLSSEPLLSSFVALHVPTYHGHRVLSFIVRTLVHTIAYCQCVVQLLHVYARYLRKYFKVQCISISSFVRMMFTRKWSELHLGDVLSRL